jgi:hypothetical protein
LRRTFHYSPYLFLFICTFIFAPLHSAVAQSQFRVSEVGTEAVGGVGVEETLTGGFIQTDLGWTHVYEPIPGEILSATLEVDLIDADDGSFELFTGPDHTGRPIGRALGLDQGLPGPWRDLQSDAPEGSVDNRIEITWHHFEDIADGTFEIFGVNNVMTIWGSNSAVLTIEYLATQEVVIDIRPFTEKNRVRPGRRGGVMVAVLGSETLDVQEIDPETLAFGPAGAPIIERVGSLLLDVNRDGLDDLVSMFRTAETGIEEGDTEACLDGMMLDGVEIEGCDMVDTELRQRTKWEWKHHDRRHDDHRDKNRCDHGHRNKHERHHDHDKSGHHR